MNDNTQSIYDLITKLCEKYLGTYQNHVSYSQAIDVKKIRAKCYEIILLKKHNSINNALENNVDPHCQILAWQFQLMTIYNLPAHAEQLRLCCEKLQQLKAFDNTTTANILLLLLQLRRVPNSENRIMEITLDRHYSKDFKFNKSPVFTYYDESRFHLSEELSDSALPQFNSENFKLPIKKFFLKSSAFESNRNILNAQQRHTAYNRSFINNRLEDERYDAQLKSYQEENNIWELASKEPPNQHHTWETFGCFSSLKEPPFLCESGSEPVTWLHNISANLQNLITGNYYAKAITEVPIKQFIKDLKYLLVGMESNLFKYNNKRELVLVSKTCVEGISPTAIESYCKDFLLCARCYKGLDSLCTPNPFTMKYVQNGYIFSELCKSIKRYLSYYRLAALSISDTSHLLAFSEHTKQLRNQITILASVCKVGPFAEAEQIPHGVALLNYLYQKVTSLTSKDVIMVLYSVLYPCCQAYFNHFLQQWILEGTVQDPYGEFFITANPKYIISRGRTYWTRSYTLLEDIVPDFITDFQNDILFCGKAMNLLKLCVPNSPLCLYVADKQPNIVSCCVTAEQILSLELNSQHYYLEAIALAGPRMLLSQAINRSHEKDDVFLSLVAKKRASTLARIELERKKEAEEHIKEKQKQMQMLQEQYKEAMRLKQARLSEKIEEDIKIAQSDVKMDILHDKIIQEEADHLINYYNELFKQVESKKQVFEKKIEALRKVKLEIRDSSNKVNISNENEPSFIDLSTKNSLPDMITKKLSGNKLSRSASSEASFLSTYEELPEEHLEEISNTKDLKSLDIINANIALDKETERDKKGDGGDDNKKNENYLNAMENFQIAQQNKTKMLSTELGISIETGNATKTKNAQNINVSILTDAQKNKLKVLSSEYGTRLMDSHKMEALKPNTVGELAATNLTDAQKNKIKVLSSEYDSLSSNVEKKKQENTKTDQNYGLTEAQKNKLKVLSSEFGYDVDKSIFINRNRPLNIAEVNRNRMMSSHDCFHPQHTTIPIKPTENTSCDNENFLNKNVISNVDNSIDKNSNNKTLKWINKKQDKLSLDFTKISNYKNLNSDKLLKTEPDTHFVKSPKFELNKVSPMSVDSTPLSSLTTPTSSKAIALFEKNDLENYSTSTETASAAAMYETGFNFEVDKSESLSHLEKRKSTYNLGSGVGNVVISKTINAKDALSVSPNCLKLYLQQSISIPLITQIKLVNNELLKYFINDLHYLKHLNSLRNYFFLMDGEFGRNIMEGLFEKLYYSDFPIDLINCHTLQALVYKALDYSTKFQENSSCLSFKINNLPKIFNLGDPDVFDCISLTYKTNWPLNILFPTETISKYDEVFKFLLKLHRVSWVLQSMFQDLKSLMKETTRHESILLMASPHYRRLHQCRHVMTHFIQTLQSYVVREVIQSSWKIFEKNLELVTNFDQLYSLHTTYIKNILFMCLLNQKSAPLRRALQKIFIVILKFYDYLRSRSWIVEDNVYVHPNFKKLEDIFNNFKELTQYLFKVGDRVVKSGYQSHLMQLLDMLDINKYYSKQNASNISISISSH